jgi:glycosyltransferase involved in cell wall biosynthesis
MNISVSVVMITYGHDKFLRKAIEGVLMQQVNFNFELIVANDCSPDETDFIVSEIFRTNSNAKCINYIKHKENIGMMPNFIFALKQAKGKYIALCEGDDYWTDPFKLQKQVDFMEANSDYSVCFHKVNILKANGELVDDFITTVPENHENLEDLARFGNYIHTPSVLFRNEALEFMVNDQFFQQSPIGDYYLYMNIAKTGKIGFLEDTMEVYRYGVGIWSSESSFYRSKNFNYTLLLLARNFRNENSDIYNILVKRIEDFIVYYWNSFNSAEIYDYLGNDLLSFEIVHNYTTTLINNRDSLKFDLERVKKESENKIKTITTKELFLELVNRFKIITWRILKFQ